MANQVSEDLKDFGRRVDARLNQAAPRIEEEVQKVVAYLNDEVVPEIRQNSSKALKIAAEKLAKLAQILDGSTGGRQ